MKSPYSTFSGYGNDGLGLIRALHRWGCDVYVQPVWVDVPIPGDLLPLFGKRLEPPFDLTINHWDPGNLKLGETPRRATRLAVAWSMWEFMPHPANKASAFWGLSHAKLSTMRERLKWYDLVLGYDHVSIQALAPYCAPHTARGVLQGGYEAAEWKPMERDWFTPEFRYFMHGALNDRKRPWTTIQAFNELRWEQPEFAEHARLSLHNTVGGIPQEIQERIPNLRVFQESFHKEVLEEFYASHHMLLAPSLGEGKNLPALEFLTTGGTVAATDVGGHAMWLTPDVGWPLAYNWQPVSARHPRGAQGAAVDVATLKAAMWEAFTNRGEAKRRGELGARLIPQQCDWSVVVERLFQRIRDLVPHNGELVYSLAQACRQRGQMRP